MRKRLSILIITILLTFVPTFVFSQSSQLPEQEKILNYNTVVKIQSDASLYVVETIEVVALNRQINRGIYRDFPTRYKTSLGLNSNTSFDVLKVLKNGVDEAYHTENYANGVRLYIGDASVIIDPGIYTYTIEYTTDRQITYLEEADGLLYNMTGNGWVFPIEKSSGEIHLPETIAVEDLEASAFWGPQGSKDSDGISIDVSTQDNRSLISYNNTNSMNSYEGFTAGVIFPKGIIEEYSVEDEIKDLLMDNLLGILVIMTSVGFAGASILLMILYGRDPKGKSIYPQYEIPEELTPALARYVDKMQYDNKVITSTVVSLGVKGYLNMTEAEEGLFRKKTFTIQLDNNKDRDKWINLPLDERDFLNSFFPGDTKEVAFTGKYSSSIKTSVDTFKSSFKVRRGDYITTNSKIYTPFLLFALLTLSALIFFGLTTFTLNFSILVIPGILILVLSLIPLPLVLKNRTRKGRDLQDTIEGLKMFITATEEEKIKIMHNDFPKDMETFNKYFPYAMALGLDTTWLKQFKSVIDKAQMENSDGTYSYGWYTGHRALSSAAFASGLNSAMTGTIASSSTPPSQSGSGGGFSGGGFSGGGGGGGGGGGW